MNDNKKHTPSTDWDALLNDIATCTICKWRKRAGDMLLAELSATAENGDCPKCGGRDSIEWSTP